MTGFSRTVGINGIDLSQWTNDEINELIKFCNSELRKRNTFGSTHNTFNYKPCSNLYHNPPLSIMIPPGQSHRHICPECGEEFIVIG